MCEKAIEENPWCLKDVPAHFRTEKICERTVEKDPWQLKDVPNHFKTEKTCEKTVEKNPWCLKYVPGHFKTEKMCIKAVNWSWSVHPIILSWLVRYSRTNKIIVRWWLWWWGSWVVRRLSKTQGPKSKNKRRTSTYCLASIKMVGLVYSWRREKGDRKIVEVTDSCF